ncbi:MAG: hypothetical protein ACREMB_20880, partial [Candidatus Rokuibacteriota bacterium]
ALGVGDALPVGRATVEAVGDRLAALLGSDAVLRRCDAVAARMRADNPFERVSTVLEGLLAGAPPPGVI